MATAEPATPLDLAPLPSARSNPASGSYLTFSSTTRGQDDKAGERLRSKLLEVGQRFVGFDKVVEEDTVQRKATERQRLQAVQEGLLKLEQAMNFEISRRVD